MRHKDARIYIAGHQGLAGSAITRRLRASGYDRLVAQSRAELDLTEADQVRRFFAAEKPEFVFLCAAKVGGILANNQQPAEFIRDNLAIQTNVIHEAWRAGVERLLFLGSSCIYPRDCPQPMKEEYLLSGPLEATNRPYAVAKIAGIEMCWSYNRQYGTRFLAVMPTNLYGPGDNYDPATSHVLPALIRKMHEAKVQGADHATVWGTGRPKREFLASDDMADAAVFLMELPEEKFRSLVSFPEHAPLINIGWGRDITISELAQMVAEVVGFTGTLRWDTSKPDGSPRKLLDVSKLRALGWDAETPIKVGIREAYRAFLVRQAQTRGANEGPA